MARSELTLLAPDATQTQVERAQRGDPAAFEALYRAHAGRVHALCLRMTGDPSRAADLTQDVFVRVWQKLGSFRGESAFTTWLQRLTVNHVLNELKSQSRRNARVFGTDDLASFDRGASDAPVETRLVLDAAIARLPKGARLAFVLHDVEGYKHREIAEMTGSAEGTVKAQLHRARKLLREMLER